MRKEFQEKASHAQEVRNMFDQEATMYAVKEFDENEPELEMLEWAGMVCFILLDLLHFWFVNNMK